MYFLGSRKFHSKREIVLAGRRIRELGTLTFEDVCFVRDLFAFHPTKRGRADTFFVGRDQGSVCFFVRYEDGSEEAFSFRCCVEHMPGLFGAKQQAHKQKVLNAAKRAAKKVLLQFKNSQSEEDPKKTEVQHVNPTLVEIFEGFLQSRNLKFSQIEVENAFGIEGFHIKDNSVKEAWIEYHKDHVGILTLVTKGRLNV